MDPDVVGWLNYHHLLYFWTVAREGTIAAACEQLRVAQPTISAQLRKLETALGHKLFTRSGRTLVLTETGRVVYRYADEIFSIGRDLMDTLKGRPTGSPLRFQVGVADVVPKLMTHRLLAPALRLRERIQIICYEGKPTELLARLAVHELDVVLSDSPSSADTGVRAFNHLLGECTVSIFAPGKEASRYRRGFPQSLDNAPMLLPTPNTMVRRAIDHWLDKSGMRPVVVGEFEDSALLKVFGQQGLGLFPGPTAIAKEIQKQYGVRTVGEVPEVQERFYAISMERRVKHPAVVAVTNAARGRIFA
jgi:LysR family transcriptional activator of nhaA